MNRQTKITLAPANKSANNVAQSQTPGGAGNLTLNGAAVSGGVATFDIPRRVAIVSTVDETGKTFTITGTDRYGRALTEALAGGNNTTVYSVNDFATITQIAVSGATTAAITVGQGDKVSSQWVPVDRNRTFNLGIGVKVSGTINYTVEHTFDDVFSAAVGVLPVGGLPAQTFTPYPHATIAAQTGNKDGFYSNQPVTAVRVTINSYSNGATLEANLAPGPMETA